MKNHEIAKIFFEIGEMLEIQGVAFKPQTYQQAAISLDEMQEDVEEVYRRGGVKLLMDLPAIGDSMAAKIEEYLLYGRICLYDDLKNSQES
jgi:DNA polymerase (family 10)